jgi:tetratricopeptide (TPR) repeat protein
MNRLSATLATTFLLLSPAAYAARPADFLVSQFAAHNGDPERAAASMFQALAGDPANPELREDAFVLALLAGDSQATELAHDLPSNPLAQLLLATAAAHQGNWREAELDIAELPHQALADAIRPLLLAWAQQAQGLSDRAMDTLQPALTNDRLGAIPLLHAALLADAAHRDGLALRLYGDLSHGQIRPSLQFAQILASWQARSGNMDAARATIRAAIKASPELDIAQSGLIASLDHAQPPTALDGLARVLVQVAAASSSSQNTHDAGELLVRVALTAEPTMTDAHLLASEIAASHHQWKLAAHELEVVPASDPMYPVAQLRQATMEDRDGRPDDALATLRALSAAFPNRPEPLAQEGDVLSDQKKFPEAIDAYDRAVALLRHPLGSDWILFYARGTALERDHQWPRAQEDMNRALELSPDQPYVLNFLGYSMAERGEDLPLAREMIEKALHARPDDGAIVDSLGWVALRQGQTKEALKLLEKAAEKEPEDPSITGHLGDAYWNAGRHTEAVDQWRRALVLKPDPDEQTRIEARLKQASP